MNININGVSITLTQEQLEQIAKQTAKKSTIFIPKVDEKYWCIYTDGDIMYSAWKNGNVDKKLLSIGNIYKTKEEAEKARDIQLAKVRLKNAIAKANGDWVPDWNDDNTKKFYFIANKTEKCISIGYRFTGKAHPEWMHIKSPNIAEEILEQYENDIKLILSE